MINAEGHLRRSRALAVAAISLVVAVTVLTACSTSRGASTGISPEGAALSVESSVPADSTRDVAADLSSRDGWCKAAFDASGLESVYATDTASERNRGNIGNTTVGFAWNCVFYNADNTWGFVLSWTPSTMEDISKSLSDALEVFNPLVAPQTTQWDGAEGTFAYGIDSWKSMQVRAGSVLTGADGSQGFLSIATNAADASLMTESQAQTAASNVFAFAKANPPQNFTE